MLRRLVVPAIVAAFAVAWCGCGAVGDVADRPVRLPAAFPADVPLPEGATLRSVQDLGVKGLNLVFETDEHVAAVEGRLRSRLAAGGWELLSDVAVEKAVFSSYRKSARTVALGISRIGEVTVVGLTYQRPEREQGGTPG